MQTLNLLKLRCSKAHQPMFLHHHWHHRHHHHHDGIVDLVFIHTLVSYRKLLENEWLIAHSTLWEFQCRKRKVEGARNNTVFVRELLAWLREWGRNRRSYANPNELSILINWYWNCVKLLEKPSIINWLMRSIDGSNTKYKSYCVDRTCTKRWKC